MPKYKNKYKKEITWEEALVFFVMKVVGLTALFFIVAASVDVYRLSH